MEDGLVHQVHGSAAQHSDLPAQTLIAGISSELLLGSFDVRHQDEDGLEKRPELVPDNIQSLIFVKRQGLS